ncbi:MAG: serine/threonine-protein kinase [Planctomycetota bacterium]
MSAEPNDTETPEPAAASAAPAPPGAAPPPSNGTNGGRSTPGSDTASLRSSETFGVHKTDSEIGKAVVELGLITPDELEEARTELKNANAESDPSQRSLTDILVARQLLTQGQAQRIRKRADQRRAGQVPGYQLMGQLGKGAMATVYRARQLSLDRIVALKVLPERSSRDPDFVDRFYKEGQAAARLSHNNIVQAIDVGETPDGRHYFVMEYLEGKTLYDIMQPPPVGEGRNFSENEALDIGIQMADALAHAHKRGLIHRDVKPKNIILTPDGKAKLTDLGLARDVSDKAAAEGEAGKAFGTPYYISPEQIRGEVDVDHRADLYGLGATLYHLLVGRPPYEGDSPTAVMHKHLRDELVPPDHLNVALGAGISEVIEYSMAKRREERYQNADQMVEDLRLVAGGEPPRYARQAVDFGSLADMEQSARQSTIDVVPPSGGLWDRPEFIVAVAVGSASVLVNIILLLFVIG